MAHRRRRIGLISAVALAVGLLAPAATASAPAGAAPSAISLAMVAGSGTLTLRGSTDPADLGTPTTLNATVEDAGGALTAGSFSTPKLSFSFPITSPITATVYVDAVFTQVTPASATGQVTPDDDVAVDMMLKAALHIEVGRPAILSADCMASPVPINLRSTAPYDRATHRVALADSDFAVPAVPINDACPQSIADGVNERLAGGGHAIELVLVGDLPDTRAIGVATNTTLVAAPAVARPGQAVQLTATVAPQQPVPIGDPLPTGQVEFKDGAEVLGAVELAADGTATLSTSDLEVGHHAVVATYRGDQGFSSSASAPATDVFVAANPEVAVDMADTVRIGGLSRPLTLTVTNPADVSIDVSAAAIDLTIARGDGNVSALTPERLVLEMRDGDTWAPVALTAVGTTAVTAALRPGFALAPGETRVVRLRLTAPGFGTVSTNCGNVASQATCPGPVDLKATLVELDSGGTTLSTLSEDTHRFTLVEGVRRSPELAFLLDGPIPHTVRQGFSTSFVVAMATFAQTTPTGPARVLIDGRVTPVRQNTRQFDEGYSDSVDAFGGAIAGYVLLPTDIDPGPHEITVEYLGDSVFAPQSITSTLTVLPSVGTAFVCRQGGFSAQNEWGAGIELDLDLPASAAAGQAIDLGGADVVIHSPRADLEDTFPSVPDEATSTVGDGVLVGVSYSFGPTGSGTGTTLARHNGSLLFPSPDPVPEADVDQLITLGGTTASVTIDGAPGDVVPVTLEQVDIDFVLGGSDLVLRATCVPRGDTGVVLGQVEVAGTTLEADPDSPVREQTDEVTLTAHTYPSDAAGVVTFTDDVAGALGTAPVVDGSAALRTDDLAVGTHHITAAFDATDAAVPDTTSAPLTLEVTYSPRSGTEAFVVAALTDFVGHADPQAVQSGARRLDAGTTRATYLNEVSRSDEWLTGIVNGLYRDTLGRDGDAAGVAFWVGQLRAGWTVARVSASFYSSTEYFTRAGGTLPGWVDDLYVKMLDRPAEASGRDFWVQRATAEGRGRVALQFFQSQESARDRVTALYRELLGRAPSPTDRDYWVPVVVTRGDLRLAVVLAASAEYNRRAGVRFPLI